MVSPAEQSICNQMLENGDIITPAEFLELLLGVSKPLALTLLSMSYGIPNAEVNGVQRVHDKLVSLGISGTKVHLGVDNSYANRIVPDLDLPICYADILGKGEFVSRQASAFQELQCTPNTTLAFHGSEKPPFFPLSKIDHRKLLLVNESDHFQPDYGVVFGFNMNGQVESSIDSGVYITDPDVLSWLQLYSRSPHYSDAVHKEFENFVFVTRELTKRGNELADKEIADVIAQSRKEIFFCSQWLPDSVILNNFLEAAERGVKVSIYSNCPPFGKEPLYGVFRSILLKKIEKISKRHSTFRLYVPHNHDTHFHLKSMIVDPHSNTAVALTGTDNMANRILQKLGVRETLVRLNDEPMVNNFYNFLAQNVFPYSKPHEK